MCRRFFSLIIPFVFLLFNLTTAFSSTSTMENLYNSILEMSIDEDNVLLLQNISIQREMSKFNFNEGKLYFSEPVEILGEEIVHGAFYIGDGSFIYEPIADIEKGYFAQYYDTEQIDCRFSYLYLIFSDSTYEELVSKGIPTSSEITEYDLVDKRYCEDYLNNRVEIPFPFYLLTSLHNPQYPGFFYVHVGVKDDLTNPLFFLMNPYMPEGVRFYHRHKESIGNWYYRLSVNQTRPLSSGTIEDTYSEDAFNILNVFDYVLKMNIDNSMNFEGEAEVTLTTNIERCDMGIFFLGGEVKCLSVTDEKGTELVFQKRKDSPNLAVMFEEPLMKNDTLTLNFTYKSKELYRSLWYPKLPGNPPAVYKMTFKYPEQYLLNSNGKKISDVKNRYIRTAEWIQDIPVRRCTFTIGLAENTLMEYDNIPDMNFIYWEKKEKIALERAPWIAAGCQLYQQIFGPMPLETIQVTTSFSNITHLGIINLPLNRPMLPQYPPAARTFFQVREISRQWWGGSITRRTYHDEWLVEGMAEYASLLYLEFAMQDKDTFCEIMDLWNADIFNKHKFLISKEFRTGPLWLGRRNQTEEAWGEGGYLMYSKGAYIIHMLRNLMLDLDTMNEDQFFGFLREIYTTYQNHTITTREFREMAELFMGMELEWFFNQWVYTTDLPRYIFSYSYEKNAEDQYILICRISQKDVPPDFKMIVPLTIKFEGGQEADLPIWVRQPVTKFELPPLPLKPKQVLLNRNNAVLAKVEYCEWVD
ncbi:MAG: M1 family aminopeptidase [Candidatus Electryonea clarkiae]|nr:M1 family aminopeptidase [Candidatus Electryonea clarkiae]MDP8285267.1 M1 family aminopeptidase [Candidatus Electryonea clarkiae]